MTTFHWRASPQRSTKVEARWLGFWQCHHGQCLRWVHESLMHGSHPWQHGHELQALRVKTHFTVGIRYVVVYPYKNASVSQRHEPNCLCDGHALRSLWRCNSRYTGQATVWTTDPCCDFRKGPASFASSKAPTRFGGPTYLSRGIRGSQPGVKPPGCQANH